jgi:hypothetical protein
MGQLGFQISPFLFLPMMKKDVARELIFLNTMICQKVLLKKGLYIKRDNLYTVLQHEKVTGFVNYHDSEKLV